MNAMKTVLLAGVAIVAFSGAALAQTTAEPTDYRGLYLGGFGGWNKMNAQESTAIVGGVATVPSQIKYDNGYALGAEAGWSWGNGFRTGLEYAYRDNDVEKTETAGTFVKGGGVNLHTVMLNAAYDLPLQLFGFARPYAGAGIGAGFIDVTDVTLAGPVASGDDTVLAYQVFGGMNFNITPRLAASLEYRYVATDDFELNTTPAGRADYNYGAHNVLAGLRYQFGEEVAKAAPVAAPAPAPAPIIAAPAPRPVAPAPVVPPVPQTYIVFFDFDKSVLTPEANQVLQRAAQDIRVGKGVRIQVIGHADRSGSNNYNQRLSERRGTVVKNELVNLGVPADQVTARGVGETQPRVPTADGVREAQNRRAEIIFQ